MFSLLRPPFLPRQLLQWAQALHDCAHLVHHVQMLFAIPGQNELRLLWVIAGNIFSYRTHARPFASCDGRGSLKFYCRFRQRALTNQLIRTEWQLVVAKRWWWNSLRRSEGAEY